MFSSGSAQMFDITRKLLDKVTGIIKSLPNEVSIRGHTDSTPYGAGASYTNWELSTDRANAARREIIAAGFETDRIADVIGKADSEHLLPEKPNDPQNRRISVVLLKEELANPEAFAKKTEKVIESGAAQKAIENKETQEKLKPAKRTIQVPIGTFRRTPGAVEFP